MNNHGAIGDSEVAVKKLKHEAELVKAAILASMKYGEERGEGSRGQSEVYPFPRTRG